MTRRQLFSVAALLLTGCLPEPHLRERLSQAEAIGTYRLTTESLRLLATGGFHADTAHQYTITLYPDGIVSFASVLVEFETINYTVASGRWYLEHNTKGDSWSHKANALRLELRVNDGGYTIYFNFRDMRSAPTLWNYYGDPDAFRLIEYTKVA